MCVSYSSSLLPASSLFVQFDSLLVDYVHGRKFPILGPVATWSLRAATVGVLVGVYQFNTNDIGASLLKSLLSADAVT